MLFRGSFLKKLLVILSSLAIFLGGFTLSVEKASALSGNEPTYTYWKQSSSTFVKQEPDVWVTRTGYTHGPGTQKFSYASPASWSVTSAAELSDTSIKSALSSKFKKPKTLTESLSCPVEASSKVAYQTRDINKHYNVTLVEWISIDGRKSKTGRTKTVSIKRKTAFEDRCHYKGI